MAQKGSEKAELFKKIEPYLTFLNIHQLERQGVHIQSKIQELEELNNSLRERDKVKDDAMAYLSDQFFWLYPYDFKSLSENRQQYQHRSECFNLYISH